jgi:hypothetical protein
MCCEHLVCARCAGSVADAGCPVCRAARAEVHTAPGLPAAAVVLAIAVLLALVAVVETVTR